MHAYDNPGISAHEFLLQIMRDQTLALQTRITAAHELCRAGLGDIGTVRTHKVSITGGMPDGADLTQDPSYQYGVASNAGQAPGHRPPRRHKGFYLVKSQ